MFLALRELSFARGRFLLMGTVVALVSLLMVLLSGLSVGLVNDGVSGLQKLPVTSFAFESEVDTTAAFSRSVVDVSAAETWAGVEGVDDAAPFGNTLVNTRTGSGLDIDLALLGVDRGSWLAPDAEAGAPLTGPGQVVLAGTLQDEGVSLGDIITVDQVGTELEVVGFVEGQHTYGHVDVGFVDLSTWQEVRAGVRPGEDVPGHVYETATAIAVSGTDDPADLAAGDRAAGTASMTLTESFDASPGYAAETSTLELIQWFLYAISALVVGAFFTVVTIQRTHEIAVLRALGASRWFLLRDSLVQSAVLLLGSTAVGLGLGLAVGASLSASAMPFALETAPVAVASTLLVALGMVGAVVAVVRITRVDPLTALGGNR